MSRFIWPPESYERIVKILRARTGLALRADQSASTRQAIETAMRRAKTEDVSEYCERLTIDMRLLDDLIVELTVGETYFFREPDHFEFIRREVIPALRERRGPDHVFRIWSAGCASGEEPFSLAILCQQEGWSSTCDILATDISSAALAKAENGQFRAWSLRGRQAGLAQEYLTSEGKDEFQLDQRIRRMVRFEFLNLALDVYPSYVTGTHSLDLILCRNVLIYFDPATVEAVGRRLFDCLAPGGWLITASGDPPIGNYAGYETVTTDHGVFYRKPLPDLKPPSETRPPIERSVPLQFTPVAKAPPPTASLRHNNNFRPVTDQLLESKRALVAGDYTRAIELSEQNPESPGACVIQVKALANLDVRRAEEVCRNFAQRHPLSAELQYLRAALLVELNDHEEALKCAQRTLFLDRNLAMAHFLLGTILQRRGFQERASRAYMNVEQLCRERRFEEIVPLSDNETFGHLAEVAAHHLKTLEVSRDRT